MTKADREFVEQTTELTARKVVEKLEAKLQCGEHGEELEVLKTTSKDNKKHIDENRKYGNNDRKMIITGIGLLIVGEILMKIFI